MVILRVQWLFFEPAHRDVGRVARNESLPSLVSGDDGDGGD